MKNVVVRLERISHDWRQRVQDSAYLCVAGLEERIHIPKSARRLIVTAAVERPAFMSNCLIVHVLLRGQVRVGRGHRQYVYPTLWRFLCSVNDGRPDFTAYVSFEWE